MGLYKLLEKNRTDIVKSWFKEVIKTYPEESTSFMSNVSDPFANPVGSNTLGALEKTYNALIGKADRDALAAALDPVIRIRAVQLFKPSEAVAFVFALKEIVGKLAKDQHKELAEFNRRVDELALVAFDIYMGCREQIFSFRANHVRSRTLNLLEKADILCEVPDVGTEIIPHDVYKNGGFDDE